MGSTSGMGSSTSTVSNVSVVVTPMPGLDSSPTVAMAEVQVSNMEGQINSALSDVSSASDADQIADQIIADNIKEQQKEQEEEQQETGEYGDQTTLVAYMGYVPGFVAYTQLQLPQATSWYASKDIYTTAYISDNIQAFYGLASSNINTLNTMISSQPNLIGE
jgi:hypothetical protein